MKWNGLFRFGPTGIFGTSFEGGPWALSIQQKFRFEISEIPRAQSNPDPSHRALGYCKQDTKERYWVQQFDRPKWSVPFDVATEITRILG